MLAPEILPDTYKAYYTRTPGPLEPATAGETLKPELFEIRSTAKNTQHFSDNQRVGIGNPTYPNSCRVDTECFSIAQQPTTEELSIQKFCKTDGTAETVIEIDSSLLRKVLANKAESIVIKIFNRAAE